MKVFCRVLVGVLVGTAAFLAAGAANPGANRNVRAPWGTETRVSDISYLEGEDAATANDYRKKMCKFDFKYPQGVTGFPTVVWFHGGGLTRAITGKGVLAPRVEGWVPWRTPKGMGAARKTQRGWGENAVPLAERDLTKIKDGGSVPTSSSFWTARASVSRA